MNDLSRRGWRYFKCEECGARWESSTRDHLSPSVEGCPQCGEDARPIDSASDTNLEVDRMGNLVRPETVRL